MRIILLEALLFASVAPVADGSGYFTCASEDTLSCYGNAHPVRAP